MKSSLQATLGLCTVHVMVTCWTCITTLISVAAEFGIHASSIAIFPARRTIGAAFQPQNQHGVGEATSYHNQNGLWTQFHCAATLSSSHTVGAEETLGLGRTGSEDL